MEDSDQRNLEILFTGTYAEANLLKGILGSEGVPAFLRDEIIGTTAPYLLGAGISADVKVLVAKEDMDSAREVADAFLSGKAKIVSESGEYGEPRPAAPGPIPAIGASRPPQPALYLILSVLCVAAVYHYFCPRSQNFHYFSRDARDNYRGIAPVSASYAERLHTYRFNYGFNGMLRSVESLWGGEPSHDDKLRAAVVVIDHHSNKEVRRFKNQAGNYCADDNHVFSEVRDFDSKGHLRTISFLNDHDEPTEDIRGVARIEVVTDDRGRMVSTFRQDKTGKRIADSAGYYEKRMKYDDLDRLIELANFGPNGQPLQAQSGIARIEYRYNTEPRYEFILAETVCHDASDAVFACPTANKK